MIGRRVLRPIHFTTATLTGPAKTRICAHREVLNLKQLIAAVCATALATGTSGPAAYAAATLDVTDMNVLEGLAPMASNKDAAKAARDSNLTVSGDIQSGKANQPLLLSFPDQQQQALRDAFITNVAYELADGLGSGEKLGGAYRTNAIGPLSGKDCEKSTLTIDPTLPAVASVIGFANATSHHNSELAKSFFANETIDGTELAPAEVVQAIMDPVNGIPNAFGPYGVLKAEERDLCKETSNCKDSSKCVGNPRPFLTEHVTPYNGKSFFKKDTTNAAYLCGCSDLTQSPAYPSGHTTYGHMESLLLALLVPERYQQMVTRAAEYGNDRIVLGAHYPMDVLAGRTLAEYDLAQLLANTPGYVGVNRDNVKIDNFQKALKDAAVELTAGLAKGCDKSVTDCDAKDRFDDPVKNSAFYESTQTYGLPVVFPNNAERTEDVAKLAPEAGYLLTMAFPGLTLPQADGILTQTEGPGGGFLDNGSAFGVYSRLDLYKAAEQASAFLRGTPHDVSSK